MSAVRPEDVLADGAESAVFAGRRIRKGTVAAFVANVQALRNCTPGTEQHKVVWAEIVELAPQLAAVGVFDVLRPKDDAVVALVESLERQGPNPNHAG